MDEAVFFPGNEAPDKRHVRADVSGGQSDHIDNGSPGQGGRGMAHGFSALSETEYVLMTGNARAKAESHLRPGFSGRDVPENDVRTEAPHEEEGCDAPSGR